MLMVLLFRLPRLSGSVSGMKKLTLFPLLLLLFAACSRTPQSETVEIYVFGTLATITVWDAEPAARDAAIAEITQTFQQMHHEWHAWKPGPLVDINREIAAGEQGIGVLPSIASLISRSQQLYRQSDGLFNPAIGGLLNLWGFQGDDRPNGPPPDKGAIARWVAAAPGMDDITLIDGTLSSSNKTVQLDFGAFAKGVAVDRAIEILRSHGVDNAIVNAGGDLRAIGSKGDTPWRVGIRHPQGKGVLAALVVKGDESIYTSGNYERYHEYEGVHYAHILDPRTGMPVSGITSVTVIHENGGIADAAATALVVAGVKDWHRIARQMGIHYAMLVDDAGTVYMNPAMQQRIEFTGETPANIVVSEPLNTR
jgi:thiamine biosynthesis lipoprotein